MKPVAPVRATRGLFTEPTELTAASLGSARIAPRARNVVEPRGNRPLDGLNAVHISSRLHVRACLCLSNLNVCINLFAMALPTASNGRLIDEAVELVGGRLENLADSDCNLRSARRRTRHDQASVSLRKGCSSGGRSVRFSIATAKALSVLARLINLTKPRSESRGPRSAVRSWRISTGHYRCQSQKGIVSADFCDAGCHVERLRASAPQFHDRFSVDFTNNIAVSDFRYTPSMGERDGHVSDCECNYDE